jgi:hypothetical protein
MSFENVKLGYCDVQFGGVNLGLTKGGVELKMNASAQDEPKLGLPEGYAPRITNVGVEASCPLAELTLANLLQVFPWCSTLGNLMTIRDATGEAARQYAKTLILTAVGGEIITFPLALPLVTSNWRYVNNSERVTIVIMKALPDLNGNLMTLQLG